MAGDEIVMPENAFLMIHDPSGIVVGSATDMRDMAGTLDKIAASMTRGYAAKSGKPEAQIAALMAAETWFDATDALDLGLATRLAEPVRIAASFDIARFRNAPIALVEAVLEPEYGPSEPDSSAKRNEIAAGGDPPTAPDPESKVPAGNVDPVDATDDPSRSNGQSEGVADGNIFEGDAFSIIELTRALENIPFKAAILSGAGLFGSRGVRQRTVIIESRDGTLSLIPFSERGSAYESQVPERRDMRAFVCRQFKKQDVLWASEIQAICDFGSETATQQVQTEVARKMGRLRNDAEATFEFHLFNGIQGVVKDPKDGATVINYYTEFGITPAAEVDFDLDNATPASGALRKRCQAMIESVEDSLGGLAAGQVQLRAECGSAFFADLVAHKEVRETYLNTAAAADLRGRVGEEVSFGGITFRRYRGGLGFGVPTDKSYFYPEGVEGLFEIYFAPADTFETVNTLGLPLYARMIPDRDRDEWVRLEIESNPLPICTRPQVLRSARRT